MLVQRSFYHNYIAEFIFWYHRLQGLPSHTAAEEKEVKGRMELQEFSNWYIQCQEILVGTRN